MEGDFLHEYMFDGYEGKITTCSVFESIKWLIAEKSGCATYYLDKYRKNENGENVNIALVIGWQNGFDESEQDSCSDGTWRICAKIGYQPSNSIMQCDYDMDWNMPWDKKTGDCIDSEFPIYENTDLVEVLKELEKDWKWINKNWNKLGHE